MACQLTFSDREQLLNTFDSLKDEHTISDEQVILEITNWAKQLTPHYGYERTLLRDITTLSRYLNKHKDDSDILGIARGALKYVLKRNLLKLPILKDFENVDIFYVCKYAVNEIRHRLGENASFNPPRLTKKEQKKAEDIFLQCLDNSKFEDVELISKAKLIIKDFYNLTQCGLFGRLRKNIEFLITILEDPSRNHEYKNYARAALIYFVFEEDAIDDSLGIIGYLDDNFIAQLAVDFIEPDREPWLDFLDEIIGVWPFLNCLVIDDGSGGRPISEYMIINSALTCSELQEEENEKSIVLITPTVGPTTFLMGFICCLGVIFSTNKDQIFEKSFKKGQKVLVDHDSVREFLGYVTINGRKMFILGMERKEKGQKLTSSRLFPISDIHRLVPVDSSRVPRGKVSTKQENSTSFLPSLEYLFISKERIHFPVCDRIIVVVMPVVAARDFSLNYKIFGHRIRDTFPMGHLIQDFDISLWSPKFGEYKPLLIFISDLDEACAYVDEHQSIVQLIVIDCSGKNKNKSASLRRLKQSNIPIIRVYPEKDSDGEILSNEENAKIWEWRSDDFSTLLWPTNYEIEPNGSLACYEHRLRTLSGYTPEIRQISLEETDQVFETLKQLQKLSNIHRDDTPNDLNEILHIAYRLISHLLRFAAPLNKHSPTAIVVNDNLEQISRILQISRYLSNDERSTIKECINSIRNLYMRLLLSNPKYKLVQELLIENPTLSIICLDSRIIKELKQAYIDYDIHIISVNDNLDDCLNGAIIPGWFRKERMSGVLIPPVASPLYLVFYDIERKWYDGYHRQRKKLHEVRSHSSSRNRIFPNIKGWKKNIIKSNDNDDSQYQSSFRELSSIETHLQTTNRERLCRYAGSNNRKLVADARMIVFENGMYGFFTEWFKANVVTHLLDSVVEDENDRVSIKQKSIEKLCSGDAILFHLGSNSDVIRIEADKSLAPGKREISSLWRIALKNYVDNGDLSLEQIWKQLCENGCPLKMVTIKNWLNSENMIAPQKYERDVLIIAKITKDEILLNQIDNVLSSIREVRSEHLKVSRKLARQIVEKVKNNLTKKEIELSSIDFDSNSIIVRISDIDEQKVQVRTSLLNRLLEDERWYE